MRIRPVFSVLGFLIAIVGALMLTALPFSLYFGDSDVNAILVSSLITMVTGALIWFTFRRFEGELRVREGFAVVTLGWASVALFGSLPFYLSDAIPVFTDAYFESISGLTTTGASILTDIESLPHGILYWRSFTHWIGGMGIILLSVAVLPL
ncbi:MAG: potassium transporter TrkG, partial [Bacteroidota bacterium]